MIPRRDLPSLRRQICGALARLRVIAEAASSLSMDESDRAVEHVILSGTNHWSQFCRAYALSAALSCKPGSGPRVSTTGLSTRGFSEVIRAALTRTKAYILKRKPSGPWTRADEPPWHYSSTLIDCLDEIGASHVGLVQAAFSTGSHVFADMPVWRNFYAHRNGESATRARRLAVNYGVPIPKHPTTLLLSAALYRPQVVLLDSIDDLMATASLLCD